MTTLSSFLEEFIGIERAHKIIISKSVFDMFEHYSWKGNIRELKNLISYALYMLNETDDTITSAHMPAKFLKEIGKHDTKKINIDFVPVDSAQLQYDDIGSAMESMEIELIRQALRENNNSRSKAAKALGRSRSWIYKRINKFNIV